MLATIYDLFFASGAWLTLLGGLYATCKITLLALVLGTVLGAVICLMRMSSVKPLKWFARVYIAVLRGTPVLMLLMMLYYVILAGTFLDAEMVAVIAFGINSAAYIAELMRSGIEATDKGQVNAARTLGFGRFQAFWYITLPQAANVAKPVYESTIINLLQWTSVVGYVTITDLTRVINTMSARTMKPVLMICCGMLLYLAVAYIVKGLFALSDMKKAKKIEKLRKKPLPVPAENAFENLNVNKEGPVIKVRGLSKSFGSLEVLKDVDLDVKRGEIICILGGSGCGKSVFLHLLEMLLIPDSGDITIDGYSYNDKNTDVNRLRRKMGMVYQNYYLFSHLNVMDNMTLAPIKILKMPKEEAESKAMALLNTVGLGSKAYAMPDKLSGGQKQRIAIARSLMMGPEVMLFDEPTSALDPGMVGEVLATIRMLSRYGLTMLIVTHEMNFARNISDRVLFFADKGIYEEAPPEEFFEHPQKEKTIAFVRKLKTMEILINEKDFDLIEVEGKVQSFAIWYGISAKDSYRLRLYVEELIYEYINQDDESVNIRVELEFSGIDNSTSLYLDAEGPSQNIFEESDSDDVHLGVMMIKQIASSYKWSYSEGVNHIEVRM